MQKRIGLIALACLTTQLASPSNAGATPTDNTENNWLSSTSTTIGSISTGNSGHSIPGFYNNGAFITCTGGFKISRSHSGHEQMLKVALAAVLAGSKISVAYEQIVGGATPGCWVKQIAVVA
jgi:hypothetical protein